MARLSKKRRQELEDYWKDGHKYPRYLICELDGKEIIYSEHGGLAVGTLDRIRSEAA